MMHTLGITNFEDSKRSSFELIFLKELIIMIQLIYGQCFMTIIVVLKITDKKSHKHCLYLFFFFVIQFPRLILNVMRLSL